AQPPAAAAKTRLIRNTGSSTRRPGTPGRFRGCRKSPPGRAERESAIGREKKRTPQQIRLRWTAKGASRSIASRAKGGQGGEFPSPPPAACKRPAYIRSGALTPIRVRPFL